MFFFPEQTMQLFTKNHKHTIKDFKLSMHTPSVKMIFKNKSKFVNLFHR